MPHFYVDPRSVRQGRFVLSPEESAHVAKVLRKKAGDAIGLFDGVDRAYGAVLDRVSPDRVEGRIVEERPAPAAPYRMTLFQALPKGDSFEWILEKATELGVEAVVPTETDRSVARVPSARIAAKVERWNKIVRAASAQCGRVDVPRVDAPKTFDAALASRGSGVGLIAWEGETETSLKSFFRGMSSLEPRPEVHVFVGPEGGFSPDEIDRARRQAVTSVTLGPRVLRTETAGLFVASALLYDRGLA